MPDIQEYSVSIKFKTEGSDKASKDMDKVNDSLGKMKKSQGAMKDVGVAMGAVGAAASIAMAAIGTIASKGAQALQKWGTKAFEMSKQTADYIETINLFRASMGDAADQATEFIDKAESVLGLDSEQLMHSIASFQNLSEGLGIASDRAYLMSKNLTQLSGDLSSFANISFETAQKKLLSGFSGQVKPLREYGIALDQASLQELAYSLGIDQKVKSMTRAQKTELIYYQIMKSTQKIQGDLGRSLISPANALRVMQTEFKRLARAVGSIFIPMMMRIIPVVRAVTQTLTSAAQAIAKFFGFEMSDYNADLSSVGNLLTGVSDDIDDMGDSAEGTAKKLNKMLMPFDELNNITSGSGSGSGGAGGAGAGGSLGIDLPEYDMFASLSDSFNSMIENGNWEQIGRTIGSKINTALSQVPWEDIKTKAGDIGKNIAKFLNGGISEIDWKNVGGNVAQGFNTVFETAGNFLSTFNFANLGKSVADIITGFFNITDWDNVGQTISDAITGAYDLALGFFANLDLGKVNESIWKVISNIDWLSILQKWAKLFAVIFFKLNPMGIIAKGFVKAIEAAINGVIKLLNKVSIDVPEQLQEWLGLPEKIGFNIKEVDLDIDEALKNMVNAEYEIEDSVDNTMGAVVEGADVASTGIQSSFGEASDNVESDMGDMTDEIATNFETTKSVFDVTYGDMAESNVLKTLKGNIEKTLNQASSSEQWGSSTVGNYAKGLTQESTIGKTIEGIHSKIKNGLDTGNSSYSWGSTIISQYNSGILSQQEATDKAAATFKGKIKAIFPTSNTASTWGQDMVSGLIKGMDAKKQSLIDAAKRIASNISSFIHFSKPDEGPLRDYETWMPDMIKGLSETMLSAMPTLSNAMLKVSKQIADNLNPVDLQEEYQVNLSKTMDSNVISDLRNRTSTANKSQSGTSMADATYSAISRALAENNGNTQPQVIQVNIGNKEVYKGYGQFRDEQSNMLGINVG